MRLRGQLVADFWEKHHIINCGWSLEKHYAKWMSWNNPFNYVHEQKILY
jgi:hypothetical protein